MFSVWEKPAEMVGRSDVAKMLESPEVEFLKTGIIHYFIAAIIV